MPVHDALPESPVPKPPNKSPRISLNKLAEFTTSKPTRQRNILRDQKYPTDFKGMYYKEASESVAQCIAGGLEDTSILDRTISILEQANPDKIGTQRRIAANIDAIETFQSMLDDIKLEGIVPSLGAQSPPKLTVQNVDISVRPELILRGKGRKGDPLIGAVKLHFPHSTALGAEPAGYISAVLQDWCKAHMADEGTPTADMCYVIDIGGKKVWSGVKATAQRMRDIESYCQNIAALWPSIVPGSEG